MTQSTITPKQETILKLIYRYRFVDTIQIQAFMGHKDKSRIGQWLKDLRQNSYIAWIYDPDNFTNKTKPAIYYLGINGIRHLRTLNAYPSAELRKRYREASRQPDFIARCVLIAGCCANLEAPLSNTSYQYVVEADYIHPESDYHFLEDLKPQLCFIKEIISKGSTTKKNYLLEIFDSSTPRYKLKQRLKGYVEYLDNGDWQDNFDSQPIVLIACPTKAALIYAKRHVKSLLEDTTENIKQSIRFSTLDTVRIKGVNSRIWEEI